ncbi:hypothetical protein J5N97_018302 [Dioscorea zingiberensis]|uniref:Uncharacterized protein n=1 Tax=Dioscorea zingiberensis TaxID=325984 RepID=A0A9D5HHH9_9LILI|nr:hypothetical protein J5N97_018302 [Dioscorea zingiberensis]
MASASLSAVAGAILSPIFSHIVLDKLINYLWDYLSRDHPSSSSEAAKLQQLQKECEALEDANQKLKTMQSEAKRLLKKDMQNATVIRLLKKLNDVGYEIQDLESDMEYNEMQRKVEESDQAEADMSQSEGRKRWFPFPWAKGQSSEKRRRLSSSESQNLSLDDMVNRISSLIKQINNIDSEMITQIKVDEWFKEIKLNGIYDPWAKKNERVTTSFTNERKIYGRDRETKNLVRLLLQETKVSDNISVVPILGMGGIGKTTLAQFVFNNPKIEDYFDKKVWVFVSDHFDRFRITKEIVESLSSDAGSKFPYDTTNLDFLETELRSRLTGKKKFLLVLDDVWSDKWQQLLAPLKHTKVESIKIIVTSRDPTVLAGLETGDRFPLEGLYGDACTSFFINCVFGIENPPDNYSLALQSIGRQIMKKLQGSPLAVKAVGRLLGRNLTEEHWKHVLDSELWEIGSDANDIMPALALTFHHLPEHLQLCFAFCSVFPKGHEINKHELIGMWIAHGYILESGTNSKTLEGIGVEYFEELNQSSLIEVMPNWLCKIHDLLHDLAKSVSQGEVCIYEGKRGKRISTNVRHLCVRGPVDLESVVRVSNSLRTLVLFGDDLCSQVDLEALKRIRVLVVIDRNLQEFPEAVTHLKHLRYLDFRRSSIKCVPESLCLLYQLRVLRLPLLDALPSLFHSLINLRTFMFFSADHSDYPDFVHLQKNLYEVKKEGSYKIAQLRNMNELTGNLQIRGLENIENKEETRKANLKEKGLIKSLKLCWKDNVDASCTHSLQEEVFEGLQPHHNLKHLDIQGYMGSKSPSWLWTTPAALQMLRSIRLKKCRNWSRLSPSIGMLSSLVHLSLDEMENITIEGDDTATMIFPSLNILVLSKSASVSFEGMSLSSSSSSSSSITQPQPGGRKLFPLLKVLSVYKCDVVNGLPWPMFSQLSELDITDSRGLDAQLPGCLKGLKSLTILEIDGSKCKTLFDREVMATLERLKEVKIGSCNELISMDGLQVLPSLTTLHIQHCHKLRWWWVEAGTSEQGVFLPKLSNLYINYCQDLEPLPACMSLLRSLECLEILCCPKVRSLPEGSLPPLLRILVIDQRLMKRCQQELSSEWQMITSRHREREYIFERKHKERNEEADLTLSNV